MWRRALAIVFILLLICSSGCTGKSDAEIELEKEKLELEKQKLELEKQKLEQSIPTLTTAPPTTTPAPTTTAPPTTTPAVEEKLDKVTIGEQNALKKAKSYLDYTAFSRDGLIDQLEFEGFTYEDSVYGVDNCGADWNEQAALKAKSYLDYTAFSRDGLIDQLEFEGFTAAQAEYGVKAVGY